MYGGSAHKPIQYDAQFTASVTKFVGRHALPSDGHILVRSPGDIDFDA